MTGLVITYDRVLSLIGDVIRISEVKLPEGVKPAMDRDFVIANVKASSAAQSDAGDTTTA